MTRRGAVSGVVAVVVLAGAATAIALAHGSSEHRAVSAHPVTPGQVRTSAATAAPVGFVDAGAPDPHLAAARQRLAHLVATTPAPPHTSRVATAPNAYLSAQDSLEDSPFVVHGTRWYVGTNSATGIITFYRRHHEPDVAISKIGNDGYARMFSLYGPSSPGYLQSSVEFRELPSGPSVAIRVDFEVVWQPSRIRDSAILDPTSAQVTTTVARWYPHHTVAVRRDRVGADQARAVAAAANGLTTWFHVGPYGSCMLSAALDDTVTFTTARGTFVVSLASSGCDQQVVIRTPAGVTYRAFPDGFHAAVLTALGLPPHFGER